MTVVGLEEVLGWFERISAIPRTSGQEKQVSDFIWDLANTRGYLTHRDDVDNLIVRKPAFPGQERRVPLALQAHLDMVGEKTPQSTHDFANDPIEIVRDGDVLRANGTTLGADDGIGVAVALGLLMHDDIQHGPLEFVFTTGEEVGLTGAKELAAGLLEAKLLLNLDGEREGVFLTSSAGGSTFDLTVPLGAREPVTDAWRVSLKGLRGGHSGLDINDGRGNAAKALGELVGRLADAGGVRLCSWEAPGKFNAISREGEVVVWAAGPVEDAVAEWGREVADHEPDAQVLVERVPTAEAWSAESTARLVGLMASLPQGVHSMSPSLEGLVESSLNVGVVEARGADVVVTVSIRSSDKARHEELVRLIAAIGREADAAVREYGSYPAWEFDPDNPLLLHCRGVYRRLFGAEPSVEGVHGGLECAVLKERYPDVPMVSIGSELKNCHTPQEEASVASVGRFAEFVSEIVATVS